MAITPRILPSMTVREINLRYPGCRAVFNKYGMGGCGGAYGPPEPIDFFATAHNAPLEDLLRELKEAAAQSDGEVVESSDERSHTALARRFIRTALAMVLTFGTAWGVIILSQIALGHSFKGPNPAYTQAHGHAQLFGWVGMFIMGVTYYTVPKFKNLGLSNLRLAMASFPLMLAGIVLRLLGQVLRIGPLMVISGVLEVAAVAIFAYLIIRLMRDAQTPEVYDRYVYASIIWLAVGTLANLGLSALMAIRGLDVIPAQYNDRYLHLLVFGFITNMILGYSLRILPHFMGLRQPIEDHAKLAFGLYNLGVFLNLLGVSPVGSSAFELAGVLIYVQALGVFNKPRTTVEIEGVDNAYSWFIRLAYGWLVVTAFMVFGAGLYQSITGHPPAHPYIGAYRHAITVGFITTLMMGVAYRIMPIFNGVDLNRPIAIRVSFALIAIGNLLRVGGQLATMTGITAFYIPTGISGYLELTSLAIFGVLMWKIMADVADPFLESHIILPETRVANVLDKYPQLRSDLVDIGFTHLAHLPRVPSFVTVGIASKRHGLDVPTVVAQMNDAVRRVEKK